MAILVLAALALSLGYRAMKYARIRRSGHEVEWSVPLVRWAKRLLDAGRRR